MTLLRLNSFVLIVSMLTPFASWGMELECRETKVISETVALDETKVICFAKDSTYYISQNCKSLKCDFVKKLKSKSIPHNAFERPGIHMCKVLGGAHEAVMISGKPSKRCFFKKDLSSISLNMLESWDGKGFSGPSKPMDF